MNKKISFPIAIIIILVCAISVAGLAAWQYLEIPKGEEISEGAALEDETADWKTYRNEEYGFEIKYPSNLGVFGGENVINFHQVVPYLGIDPEITIIVRDNPQQLSFEQWLEQYKKEEEIRISEKEPIVIGGVSGIKFLEEAEPYKLGMGPFDFWVVCGHGWSRIYCLYIYKNSEFLQVFNQMISTFRFLE